MCDADVVIADTQELDAEDFDGSQTERPGDDMPLPDPYLEEDVCAENLPNESGAAEQAEQPHVPCACVFCMPPAPQAQARPRTPSLLQKMARDFCLNPNEKMVMMIHLKRMQAVVDKRKSKRKSFTKRTQAVVDMSPKVTTQQERDHEQWKQNSQRTLEWGQPSQGRVVLGWQVGARCEPMRHQAVHQERAMAPAAWELLPAGSVGQGCEVA